MSPGSCGQRQHGEEETSQQLAGGCCFSFCCGFFFCGLLPFMSFLTVGEQRLFLGPHPKARCPLVSLEESVEKIVLYFFANQMTKQGGWWRRYLTSVALREITKG